MPGTGIVATLDVCDFAQLAVAHVLAGDSIDGLRPLLAADLEHALVFPGRLGHAPSFRNRQAEGLFGVDVLARLAGMNRDQCPPMIGRGGDDRIHVPTIQQAAIVLVGLATQLSAKLLCTRQIHVGNADETALLHAQRGVQHAGALSADADASDADAVIGAQAVGRGQDMTGNHQRQRQAGGAGDGAAAQELAAGIPCVVVLHAWAPQYMANNLSGATAAPRAGRAAGVAPRPKKPSCKNTGS